MIVQILGALLIFTAACLLAIPVARLMKATYNGDRNILDVLQPLEKVIFNICRIDPGREMNWKTYLSNLLLVQLFWFVFGFVILLVQGQLFLNPAHVPDMGWTLALNSAISFLTSTNLQHYSGETSATYFSQLFVFTFLQFMSAATSLCAGVAMVRGLSSRTTSSPGNFYKDFVHSCTRVLLPLCVVVSVIFIFRGMPMTFTGPKSQLSLQGDTTQVALGPVAAMIPIKELGSNGGGFYGANCAHPFENPDFFTFIIHTIVVLLLPVAFIIFVGVYLGRSKFSGMMFCVMLAGLFLCTAPIVIAETSGNNRLMSMGFMTAHGNMEGKEIRFGTFYSAFYSGINMAIPAGTVTGMHDSYMPLSAVGMLAGMQVDCFFGGLGTGWINLFIYLVIAVFIASLMIGRTPELLGRKISQLGIQIAVGVSIISFGIPLVLTAAACFVFVHYPGGNASLSWLGNLGPHGFTTMYYEYVSAMAGNGSEFSGLTNNTPFWNITTCIPMLLGRFVPIIGAFVIVGDHGTRPYSEPSPGTLKTESPTFGIFFLFVILILNVLSLFTMLLMGPITECLA